MTVGELIDILMAANSDCQVVPIIFHDGRGRQGSLFAAKVDEDGDVQLSIED